MKIEKTGYIKFININDNRNKAVKQRLLPVNNYEKYSLENLKANYLVNFKGRLGLEAIPNGESAALNHQTQFFREQRTDEIVQNYILKRFSGDSEINIVSGAASSGQEAKSYAMMLDSLGDKLHVFGFDISDNVVQQAKNNRIQLILGTNTDNPARQFLNFSAERFLIDNETEYLTPYQQKCRQKFKSYFNQSGKIHKLPVFPDASKKLDELNEILSNKEKYEKAKSDYEQKMGEMRNYFASSKDGDFLEF